ncbi:MAG: SDR family oxidoreductase [Anaerolineales bacterium]
MHDLFDLSGKTALVTGCRRGIGKAMAVALTEAGADILGVSANLEPTGSEIEREVTTLGRKFAGYTCDFADRESLHRFLAQVTNDFPIIDILVRNAGTTHRAPVVEFPDVEWDRVIEVNLNSHFILARELGKRMVTRGSGKIIFTASITTFQGGITIPAYAASKGAIGILTKALANEWASHGVQVNAIAPGYIATDLNGALRADPARFRAITDRIPAGHWGTPDDLKGPIVFLASAASNYVSGEILVVDGGWMGR